MHVHVHNSVLHQFFKPLVVLALYLLKHKCLLLLHKFLLELVVHRLLRGHQLLTVLAVCVRLFVEHGVDHCLLVGKVIGRLVVSINSALHFI